MSTANKLSYLNDTKSLLRTSLNKFGSSILSTDTFRSYDTKLNDIYDKLPKVTQSGAGFTLSDVQNGLVDDFKMNGVDLEQDTTKGNQLIDFNNPSYVNSNITWSFENDVLELEGTSGKYIDIQFNILNIISDTSNAGKVIKFGFKTISNITGSGSIAQINIYYNDSTPTTYLSLINRAGVISNTYTIPNDTSNIASASLTLYTNNASQASTGSVTIEEPLLYFDNNNTYEPYTGGIPSPNPDNPQQIKVVEGRQVITDSGKNLFTLDNQLLALGNVRQSGNNQEFTLTGFGTNEAFIYKVGLIKDFVGKTLTFKCDYTTTSNLSNAQLGLIYCDNDGSNRNNLSLFSKDNNTMTTTYTIPSSIDGNLTLAVRLYGTGNVNNSSTTYMNVQLEENSTATDYEPYHDPVDYNIDLTNDLLKYNKCDFTPTTTSWYFLNGSGSAYGSNIGTKTDIKFPVEINKKYTLRYNILIAPNTFQLCYENENVVATLGKSIGNNTFTFTSDRNGYVIPRVQVQANTQVKITDISAVEGEEDYYDYKLAKMPNTDYKNKIYKNNGNWYFEENVKKVVLDGSENWYYVNNSSYSESIIRYRCEDFTDVLSTGFGAFILSSNFKGFPLGHRTENGIARQLDSSGLNIFIDKSIINDSLTNFKNWLSTHNVEVWYPLVNPVTTQITNTTLINQLDAISVHTGTNIITISNSNNIIPEIEITRLKELEKLA